MRRPALLLGVLLLVAAACGDDGGGQVVSPPGTTMTTAAPGQPSSPSTGPRDSAAVRPPGGSTTAANDIDDDTAPDPGGAPGSLAPVFLRPAGGDRIVVEVTSNDGAGPQQGTIDHVMSVLGQVSRKSVTPTGGSRPPTDDEWTKAELRDAVSSVATARHGDGVAVLRLLFLHGHWAEDDSVLGVSFQADAAAIFVDDVRSASNPLVGAAAIEVATTTHEVGHLLGLVDLHLDTGRGDPEHPGHSSNTESVMYWAVESSLVTDLLAGGPPRDFDEADLADLATIRDS